MFQAEIRAGTKFLRPELAPLKVSRRLERQEPWEVLEVLVRGGGGQSPDHTGPCGL